MSSVLGAGSGPARLKLGDFSIMLGIIEEPTVLGKHF